MWQAWETLLFQTAFKELQWAVTAKSHLALAGAVLLHIPFKLEMLPEIWMDTLYISLAHSGLGRPLRLVLLGGFSSIDPGLKTASLKTFP